MSSKFSFLVNKMFWFGFLSAFIFGAGVIAGILFLLSVLWRP